MDGFKKFYFMDVHTHKRTHTHEHTHRVCNRSCVLRERVGTCLCGRGVAWSLFQSGRAGVAPHSGNVTTMCSTSLVSTVLINDWNDFL